MGRAVKRTKRRSPDESREILPSVTTTPKYSMTSTWESVTKVMRTTTGLEGTAAEVGMMRTRDGGVEN